ncbi:MAG: gamma-glutamyl-gamma-aminobutyrate hydrolase family protein [Bacteroidetes bacterium]|nr:gamma-glutamyl-gamma-aminobutyrate hydrolase family protein [Bacteroidota bacterium]
MKIGISFCDSNFRFYLDWLEYFKVSYEVLSYRESEKGFDKFTECDGLLLSGGVDIYPELFCDWDTKETKGTYHPDRDGFELKILESAISRKMPILGICRGLQLINVYFRGSLIFDLKEIRNVNHEKISKTVQRFHEVNILKNTMLYEILGSEKETVNSSHHQAVDRLGEGLMINAKSNDGIIEGLEYADKKDKSFMLAVQWHPERLDNREDIVSSNIINRFISECKAVNV